jgi:signal transduction histidine kinase
MKMVQDRGRKSPSRLLRTSLRARVAFGVGFPVLIALATLSITHYLRERHLLQDQIETTSSQMGGLVLGGLRHAMLTNDTHMLEQIISNVGFMESVKRLQLIDDLGMVKADSMELDLGSIHEREELGCSECHQLPVDKRPATIRLVSSEPTLRISTPINNDRECWGCHEASNAHLGMVILDVSLARTESKLFRDLSLDIAISLLSTLIITSGVYLLVHWLIVRRIEAFQSPLARFASGDHSARLPVQPGPTDEIGHLANTFNTMANQLEEQERETKLRTELKRLAIQEERERISRELHDGMAQILGYVNTKVTAVRLMLKNKQQEAAEGHLFQLEEAARELFVDIREAILGLRMNSQDGVGIADALREYSQKFSRLTNIPVDLKLNSGAEGLAFDAETEMQLLRIVQEALTNVRKHAFAEEAWIALQAEGQYVTLTIGDDGRGFDPSRDYIEERIQLGLQSMRERAESIGAQFSVDSEPGAGTRVEIILKRNGA